MRPFPLPSSMRKVVRSGFPRQSPSSSENTRCKLPIPQSVSNTLWLLVDVPYSTACAPMAKHILHQAYYIELRQVCPQQHAQLQRTHVLFDRCNTRINDATSCQRPCDASMEYKLTMNVPLPQQQLVLSVTNNKV